MHYLNKSVPLFFISLLLILNGCENKPSQEEDSSSTDTTNTDTSSQVQKPQKNSPFGDYWYQGKAELYKFSLQQARYGEHHPGYAVMIFVTEDFLTDTQVKLEHPRKTEEQATTVLKLNFIRRFTTGLYDYSLMNSIFTPVNEKKYPHSLKVTISTQDWCGQNYLQINNRKKNYQVRSHSYFQKVADNEYTVDKVYLEDEIWTKLRMDPQALPEGNIHVIPGTMYSRLMLNQLQAESAITTRQAYRGNTYPGDSLKQYTINYPDLERTLRIVYEADFPHRIAGWEESYASGFGEDPDIMTTRAVRDTMIRSDYWNHNAVRDSLLRKQLNFNGFD